MLTFQESRSHRQSCPLAPPLGKGSQVLPGSQGPPGIADGPAACPRVHPWVGEPLSRAHVHVPPCLPSVVPAPAFSLSSTSQSNPCNHPHATSSPRGPFQGTWCNVPSLNPLPLLLARRCEQPVWGGQGREKGRNRGPSAESRACSPPRPRRTRPCVLSPLPGELGIQRPRPHAPGLAGICTHRPRRLRTTSPWRMRHW